MKNIHILSTDKPTLDGLKIYITSDEYIGLSYYLDGNLVRKGVIDDKDYWEVRKDYKKIILTTDQDLIKDGVQKIDDEFLEWFVKNPSCGRVEVDGKFKNDFNQKYSIIISKEEPKQEGYICPHTKLQCDDECCVSAENCHIKISIGVLSELKQETLEGFAKKLVDFTSKWQQERSYSEEDMYWAMNMAKGFTDSGKSDLDIRNHFEQFKKKLL